MYVRKAFLAGVFGAAILSAAMGLARAAGFTSLDLEMILGSFITLRIGPGSWFLGLLVHLTLGGIFGEAYALGFEFFAHTAKVWVGAIFGAVNGVIAGLLLVFIGLIHPLLTPATDPYLPGHILAPGVFGSNYGLFTAGAFLLLHVVFGILLGLIYHQVHVHSPLMAANPTLAHAH